MIEKTLQDLTDQIIILAGQMESLRALLPPLQEAPKKGPTAEEWQAAVRSFPTEQRDEPPEKDYPHMHIPIEVQASLDDARGVVMVIADTLGRDKAKALVLSFGVDRLGDLDASKYDALIDTASDMLKADKA
jgi:hypothetical protein